MDKANGSSAYLESSQHQQPYLVQHLTPLSEFTEKQIALAVFPVLDTRWDQNKKCCSVPKWNR